MAAAESEKDGQMKFNTLSCTPSTTMTIPCTGTITEDYNTLQLQAFGMPVPDDAFGYKSTSLMEDWRDFIKEQGELFQVWKSTPDRPRPDELAFDYVDDVTKFYVPGVGDEMFPETSIEPAGKQQHRMSKRPRRRLTTKSTKRKKPCLASASKPAGDADQFVHADVDNTPMQGHLGNGAGGIVLDELQVGQNEDQPIEHQPTEDIIGDLSDVAPQTGTEENADQHVPPDTDPSQEVVGPATNKDKEYPITDVKGGKVTYKVGSGQRKIDNSWSDNLSGMRQLSAVQAFLSHQYVCPIHLGQPSTPSTLADFTTIATECVNRFQIRQLVAAMQVEHDVHTDTTLKNRMHTDTTLKNRMSQRKGHIKNVLQAGLGICWWGWMDRKGINANGKTTVYSGLALWALRATALGKAQSVVRHIDRKRR